MNEEIKWRLFRKACDFNGVDAETAIALMMDLMVHQTDSLEDDEECFSWIGLNWCKKDAERFYDSLLTTVNYIERR